MKRVDRHLLEILRYSGVFTKLLYIFRYNANEVIYCTINIYMHESRIIISIGHGVPSSYRI